MNLLYSLLHIKIVGFNIGIKALLSLTGTFSQSWVHKEDSVKRECIFINEWWCKNGFKCLWRFCPPLSVCCRPVFDLPAETIAPRPSVAPVTSVERSFRNVWSRWSSLWRRLQTVRSVATPPKGVSAHSCSWAPQPRTPPPTVSATTTSCACWQASCQAGRLLPQQQKEGGLSPWRGWRGGRGGGCPGRCTGWGKGSGGRSL